MLWTLLVPLSLAVLGVAIVVFSRDNRLGAGLASLQTICASWVACLCGLAGMLVLLARRTSSGYAPYPLAVAGLAFMAIVAFVALPLADGFKPIPPLAAVIRQEQRSGDTVGIFGVRGGNALLFYTQPRIVAMVSSRGSGARGRPGRADRDLQGAAGVRDHAAAPHQTIPPAAGAGAALAESNGDVLFLYDGPRCAARAKGASNERRLDPRDRCPHLPGERSRGQSRFGGTRWA